MPGMLNIYDVLLIYVRAPKHCSLPHKHCKWCIHTSIKWLWHSRHNGRTVPTLELNVQSQILYLHRSNVLLLCTNTETNCISWMYARNLNGVPKAPQSEIAIECNLGTNVRFRKLHRGLSLPMEIFHQQYRVVPPYFGTRSISARSPSLYPSKKMIKVGRSEILSLFV